MWQGVAVYSQVPGYQNLVILIISGPIPGYIQSMYPIQHTLGIFVIWASTAMVSVLCFYVMVSESPHVGTVSATIRMSRTTTFLRPSRESDILTSCNLGGPIPRPFGTCMSLYSVMFGNVGCILQVSRRGGVHPWRVCCGWRLRGCKLNESRGSCIDRSKAAGTLAHIHGHTRS